MLIIWSALAALFLLLTVGSLWRLIIVAASRRSAHRIGASAPAGPAWPTAWPEPSSPGAYWQPAPPAPSEPERRGPSGDSSI